MSFQVAGAQRDGLRTIAHVAGALAGRGTLAELGERALLAMREALGLDAAVLYLVDEASDDALVRYVSCLGAGEVPSRVAREELRFEPEAWRLVVAGGRPVVFHEPATWLVEHPFAPTAEAWLVLPLRSEGALVGVVVASRPGSIELDPVGVTTLTLLGDLLSAGIANARLDQALARTAVERERLRLAGEIHDGLAQDLALAVRELALLESGVLDEPGAAASRARLAEAVAAAHRVVRSRLEDLAISVPLGGLRSAVEEVCARFDGRGMEVAVQMCGPAMDVPPDAAATVLRVLSESLTNAERHAGECTVQVALKLDGDVALLEVADDGAGFRPEDAVGPDAGHFGLSVMAERARSAGGSLTVGATDEGGSGTRVRLSIPVR